jgi:ketosteroid isomerase-like protein
MSAEDVKTIQNAYDSFGRGDIPAVLSNFAADAEWIEPAGLPFSGTHRGPQAVADNVFSMLPRDWDEFSVVAERFLDAGDAVVVISRFRGQAKAGGSLDVQAAQVFELRDGKIIRMQHFADTAAWQQALA